MESIGKKARFLEAARGVVGRSVPEAETWRVVAQRAEAVARDPSHRGQWPIATARAVASLADLVELALPLLQPGGTLLAWKSGDPHDELGFGAEVDAAERAVEAIGGDPILIEAPLSDHDPSGTGVLAPIGDHRLVVVGRGRGRMDDRWPRDPAARRRQPW